MAVRILIADDEYHILSGLTALIERNIPEAEVHAFLSGTDALAHLNEVSPNIIISDVRMAELSGLDFLSAARKQYPDAALFIVSGYSEFEYARRAISLGVHHYVLKPIAHDQMLGLLREAIEELQQRDQMIERDRLGSAYASQKLISNVLMTGVCDQNTRSDIALLGLEPLLQTFCMGSLLVREYQMAMPFQDVNQLVNLRHMIAELSESAMERQGMRQYLYVDAVRGSFILLGRATTEQMECALKTVSREIRQVLGVYANYSVSSVHEGAQQLFDSYLEVIGLGFSRAGQSIFSDEEVRALELIQSLKRQVEESLVADTTIQIAAKLKLAFTMLAQQVDKNPLSVQFARELLYKVRREFQQRAFDEGIAASFDPPSGMSLGQADSVSFLMPLCDRLDRALIEYHSAYTIKRSEDLIRRAKAYIDENLDTATQEQAAQRLGVNAIYLSIVFKNTGENFRDYLIGRKIERAKVMLAGSDARVYEIAEAVGYSDIKYFSRNFKRLVGMTPQEYRQRMML